MPTPLPEYHSSPGTNHHSCENWVQAVQPIYLVPAHLWYSGRGVGICHRNREKRQKAAFGGLRASTHEIAEEPRQPLEGAGWGTDAAKLCPSAATRDQYTTGRATQSTAVSTYRLALKQLNMRGTTMQARDSEYQARLS